MCSGVFKNPFCLKTGLKSGDFYHPKRAEVELSGISI